MHIYTYTMFPLPRLSLLIQKYHTSIKITITIKMSLAQLNNVTFQLDQRRPMFASKIGLAGPIMVD